MISDRTFVSYSRDDSTFAVKLASDLRARGADVWVDQLDIEAGARWDSAVEDALRRSVRLLVVLSPKAVASQNVLDEVSFAMDEGKAVVPVLVEPCTIPMRMRRLQYVDFTRDYDAALGRLLGTLGVARQPSATPHTPPSSAAQTSPATTRSETPAAPLPASETEPHPAPVTADARGLQLRLGGIAAALVLLVVMVMIWSNQRSGEAPAPATIETLNAPIEAQPTRVAETPVAEARQDPPAKAPPIQQRRAPEKASPEVTTQPGLAPPESTSAVGNSVSLFGTGMLPRGDASDSAGLQTLLNMTRALSGRDSLSDSEIRGVADSEIKACHPLASACVTAASNAVSSLFDAVCARQTGPVPPASDEAALIKYDFSKLGCSQRYLSIVQSRKNDHAIDTILHIKRN